MSAFAAITRQGARLRLVALVVALVVLAAHFAITLGRREALDAPVAAVDVALAVLLLAAVYAHLHSLMRERRRLALATLLLDLASEPRRIREAAAVALTALVAAGLADAGLIALVDAGGPELRPLVASGYPAGWVDGAPDVPLGDDSPVPTLRRVREAHPWVDPLLPALGRRPWLATVPLLGGEEVIGVLALAATRAGALRDPALLELTSRPLAAILHQAELYEAAYARERELEDQAQRHREFLAAIAHEVRTPLTSIHAFADLITAEGADDAAGGHGELMTSLTRGVDWLTSLINDLLELGRPDADILRFDPAPVDVCEALRVAETVLRPAFMLREQSLRLELPEHAVYATADRRHLEQVMLNLLSNANRHTPMGGEIVVRTAMPASGEVRIEVDDSGPGVDPADRKRIFESYYRVRRAGAAEVPGSGLGLAVARRLTQLQGGRIWVEDVPGGGARFCVALRAAANGPASAG